MIKYEKLVLGDLQTNCFLVWDEETKEAVIIDPADDGVFLSEEIEARHLTPKAVLATHGHFDHLLGALDLKLIYSIPFCCSTKDHFLLERQKKTASHFLNKNIELPNFEKIDIDLDDTDEINLGGSRIEVIRTPGHTPGSVCFWCEDDNLLFSGDTIFYHSRGETNHGYSSTKDMYMSINQIMKLPEETEILSGHGEDTTVANEKGLYLAK